MGKKFFVFVLFILMFSTISISQEKSSLKVSEMALCTAVEERQPVGVDTVFADTVKKVFCFTKITGAEDTTTVTHVWYYKDEEMAKVDHTVKSNEWRTFSSKNIWKGWVGQWKVEVLSEDDKVLKSKVFTIKPTSK